MRAGAAALRRKATGPVCVPGRHMPLLGDFLHGEGFDDIARPMKRGFMGTPDMTLFGGSEFRQSKVLRCKTLVRTTCGAAVLRRKATGGGSYL